MACAHEHTAIGFASGCKLDICHFQQGVTCVGCFLVGGNIDFCDLLYSTSYVTLMNQYFFDKKDCTDEDQKRILTISASMIAGGVHLLQQGQLRGEPGAAGLRVRQVHLQGIISISTG